MVTNLPARINEEINDDKENLIKEIVFNYIHAIPFVCF